MMTMVAQIRFEITLSVFLCWLKAGYLFTLDKCTNFGASDRDEGA
jgi:hypothetical protein